MTSAILVTGGAGFIGANFLHHLQLQRPGWRIVNLDALTYAGNRESLSGIAEGADYRFVQADICDRELIDRLLAEEQPLALVHFAAESHVDRSIDDPAAFVRTNVNGTFTLLEATRQWWWKLSRERQQSFRFLHVSTDEVYGLLGATGLFTEDTPYSPNSPYSASKAASDHLLGHRSMQRRKMPIKLGELTQLAPKILR